MARQDPAGRGRVRGRCTSTAASGSPLNRARHQRRAPFILTHDLAADASKRGDDLQAFKHWKDLAASLKPDDKDERKWYLLAVHRAGQLEAAIHDRRQFVETQMRLADEAMRAGRPDQALTIQTKLVEQYSGLHGPRRPVPATLVQPGRTRAAASPPLNAGPPAPAGPGQGGDPPPPSTPTSPSPKPDAPEEPKTPAVPPGRRARIGGHPAPKRLQ